MNITFEQELENNIKAKIRQLRRVGTVGMGIANLLQVTPTPKSLLGAPAGPESYAVLFEKICRSDRSIGKFLTHHGVIERTPTSAV